MFSIIALTLLILLLCVAIHYEFLFRLSGIIERARFPARINVMLAICLAIVAHVVEIWIFALGYYLSLHFTQLGGFIGEQPVADIWDCLYLSFVCYSTLGFGDIIPVGWVRFLVGTEAMMGLVFIAWTASFMYIQMERYWQTDPRRAGR